MKIDISSENLPSARHEAISLLLANDPQFLDFLFTANRKSLAASPADLLACMRGFSSGQQLLIRLALDIWSESGSAPLGAVLRTLDDIRIEGLLLAIERIRFSNH